MWFQKRKTTSEKPVPAPIPAIPPPVVDKGICVRTYKYDMTVETNYTPKPQIIAYFHLFETKDGKRTLDIDLSTNYYSSYDPKKTALNSEFYHMEIYPWLHGRPTDDIPSYEEALKRDFKKDQFTDTLKGS